MRYEILEDLEVINTIEADEEFMLENFTPEQYRLAAPLPAAPVVNPEWHWYIDVGPFFDRLGANKMAVLTSTNTNIKALISDLQVRKWVDLQRPDVAAGLALIGSVIPALTPTLQAEIVGTVPLPSENLALKKMYFS